MQGAQLNSAGVLQCPDQRTLANPGSERPPTLRIRPSPPRPRAAPLTGTPPRSMVTVALPAGPSAAPLITARAAVKVSSAPDAAPLPKIVIGRETDDWDHGTVTTPLWPPGAV